MNKKHYTSPKTIAMTMELGAMIAESLPKVDETEETVGGSEALTRGGWNSNDWTGYDED